MTERPTVYARYSRGELTAKEAARRAKTSERTAQRWTSRPRDEWRAEQAEVRELTRAYHDDEGHSWPETARYFGVSVDAVKRRAYRARKERAEEERAQVEPPLPLEVD